MFGSYQNQTNIQKKIGRESLKDLTCASNTAVSKLSVSIKPAFKIKESLQKHCSTIPETSSAWKKVQNCQARGSNSTQPSPVGY